MLAPDTNLGAYRLIARIGAGGMGEVWKAEDTRLGRIVAIKILPTAVASDTEAIARMRREARTAAQLYHPNIAMIHSFEQDGDQLFIVMEFVDGQPLSAVLKRGTLGEAEICRIGRGVADALAEAHARGIVHRDIKPDNVIVSGNRVKVLDFGIAKQVGAPAPDAPATFMTQQGMILGTIQYMSPEQALGKAVDARTDIFSLGVMLYEAAVGRLPFRGETVTETMTQIIRDEPVDPQRANPQLSDGLADIIRRCIAKRREDRFGGAEELSSALEAQLGRSATAPYTQAIAADAPTVARTAATDVTVPRAAATELTAQRAEAGVPTVARTVAEPTVMTTARPAAAAPPPKKKPAGIWSMALVVLLFAGIGAAVVARWRQQASAPPVPPSVATNTAPKPQPAAVAPPAANVTVTATPQIVEKGGGAQTTSGAGAAGNGSGNASNGQAVANGQPPDAGREEVGAPPPIQRPPTSDARTVSSDQRPAPPDQRTTTSEPRPANSDLDAQYASAIAILGDGDARDARKALHRILEQDSHYAKAHFRMGEIALLNRNLEPARTELELAQEDASRLDDRERALTKLGIAVSLHSREEAQRDAQEIKDHWPNDPDLDRIVRAFPGIFLGSGLNERPIERGRRFRPH